MSQTRFGPTDAADTVWDVVVIGTGAGGAAAGLALARLGRSVLFLERGSLLDHTESSTTGSLISRTPGRVVSSCDPYRESRTSHLDNAPPELWVGAGVGGSTATFSMVMDRFRPIDLQPRLRFTTPPSSSIPDEWPIAYSDLTPYYCEAEKLFRVQGSEDPLAPTQAPLHAPPPPSQEEAVITDALAQSGLHPYRSHYARDYVAGCDGCPGKVCPRECRVDAARACVFPALTNYQAQILPDCLVVKLEVSGRAVRRAICLSHGEQLEIRGRLFVLALNALLTPALLLQSATETFPDGLGNSSGMVGRNLMLHVSDFLSVRLKSLRGPLNSRLHHGLSLNDFYVRDGVKLGNIHAHSMNCTDLISPTSSPDDSTGTVVFATIVEDFPYSVNRVIPDPRSPGGARWEYLYPDELRLRRQTLIGAFADSLRSVEDIAVREPSGLINRTHMCGTCRFGDDPAHSVLDRDNRIHDLDNAYVVDASFFPSSGGINPSLTIVANSLRVGSLIASR